MSRLVTLIFVPALLLGADNSWTRVVNLQGHNELRIYKRGAREPVNATFAEANEERIVVVVKNKETAIPREEIDRIDARPIKTGGRKVNVDSTTTPTDPDLRPHPNAGPPVPGTSSSSTVSLGGGNKPDFETIYRRTAGAAKN